MFITIESPLPAPFDFQPYVFYKLPRKESILLNEEKIKMGKSVSVRNVFGRKQWNTELQWPR